MPDLSSLLRLGSPVIGSLSSSLSIHFFLVELSLEILFQAAWLGGGGVRFKGNEGPNKEKQETRQTGKYREMASFSYASELIWAQCRVTRALASLCRHSHMFANSRDASVHCSTINAYTHARSRAGANFTSDDLLTCADARQQCLHCTVLRTSCGSQALRGYQRGPPAPCALTLALMTM